MATNTVNDRFMVVDVVGAVGFYTRHFGFDIDSNAAPAFAAVVRGELRLLLSGPTSSWPDRCRRATRSNCSSRPRAPP